MQNEKNGPDVENCVIRHEQYEIQQQAHSYNMLISTWYQYVPGSYVLYCERIYVPGYQEYHGIEVNERFKKMAFNQ